MFNIRKSIALSLTGQEQVDQLFGDICAHIVQNRFCANICMFNILILMIYFG